MRLLTRPKQYNDWHASDLIAALTVVLFECGDSLLELPVRRTSGLMSAGWLKPPA